MSTKVLICKKIEDEPACCPDCSCKYRDHAKILIVFKRWYNCLILCEIIFQLEILRDQSMQKSAFKRRNSTALSKFSIFYEYALILTKCLLPCIFELTDVYYINLISIILPSRYFLFKIFLRSSKLWLINQGIYLCLTNLLRPMTCFCMRKHIDISKMIINFLML